VPASDATLATMSHPRARLRPPGMNTNQVTIELPRDDEEAVRLLRHELRVARRRLAESRRRAGFRTYRRLPMPGVASTGTR